MVLYTGCVHGFPGNAYAGDLLVIFRIDTVDVDIV